MTPPGLIVDLFAGGGASEGIRAQFPAAQRKAA